jgi:hypothetical protein
MNRAYTVGRGSAADIQTPKVHDAVGKVHISIEEVGQGQIKITDLKSTNGTFVRVGSKWEEVKGARTVAADTEIMLGDFKTTPRKLLAEAETVPLVGDHAKPKYRSSKDDEEATPPTPPVGRRRGPRRNEFGEIVHE